MIYLLDTQLVLWSASGSPRLPERARDLLQDPASGFMFSSAVIWEVSVKLSLGRPDFAVDPRLLRRGLLDNGASELAITGEHGIAVLDLPPVHRDPFDRIQVAQARVEGLVLARSDRVS
jgi:PIN domain nuclease of toxin-antitoxin system